MTYIMCALMFGLVLGLVAVASNPSPYFGALGLVVVAGMGCGVLVGHGAPFLSLILFLLYLGGMLVVFAYSTALVAEPCPETLGSASVTSKFGAYLWALALGASVYCGGWYMNSWVAVDEGGEFSFLRGDTAGIVTLYFSGGWLLAVAAGGLLLTLFVVLEVSRGLSWGVLRAF